MASSIVARDIGPVTKMLNMRASASSQWNVFHDIEDGRKEAAHTYDVAASYVGGHGSAAAAGMRDQIMSLKEQVERMSMKAFGKIARLEQQFVSKFGAPEDYIEEQRSRIFPASTRTAQDSLGEQFIAQEAEVVRVIRKVFGNVRVKNGKTYSTDASFLMESDNRTIVVKLGKLGKRRQRLSVWASIIGRRDGLMEIANFTGFDRMERSLLKLSQSLLKTLSGYDGLSSEQMKEMERASQLNNEGFASHISSVVASRLASASGAGNSDVGTDNRFWFQVDIETEDRPMHESKSGKIYVYHNRPVTGARSVASQVNKVLKGEKWSFSFGNVERMKRAKVVNVDPYRVTKEQSGDTVDVYYNNTLHMEIEISG